MRGGSKPHCAGVHVPPTNAHAIPFRPYGGGFRGRGLARLAHAAQVPALRQAARPLQVLLPRCAAHRPPALLLRVQQEDLRAARARSAEHAPPSCCPVYGRQKGDKDCPLTDLPAVDKAADDRRVCLGERRPRCSPCKLGAEPSSDLPVDSTGSGYHKRCREVCSNMPFLTEAFI